jgi:hypothetical protein
MYIMQAGRGVTRGERPDQLVGRVAGLGKCCCAGLLASLASHDLSLAGVKNRSDGIWE